MYTDKIEFIHAREVIDCRGAPTVEVDIHLESGVLGRASVPAGLSTGTHEAHELRDGKKRYRGLGVRRAVKAVNEIIGPEMVGKDVTRQRDIDALLCKLDGTANKSRFGSNAILGVSLAAARAAAETVGLPLYRYLNAAAHIIPVPLFNLINGGKHASGDMEIQEFIIMPIGAKNLFEALQIATEVSWELKDIIIKKYGKIAANVGDEGGFVPPMEGVYEPLDSLVEAVSRAGYTNKIVYGMDVASTHFYNAEEQSYTIAGKKYSRQDMITLYKDLCSRYKLVSIEDALYEDDFEGWVELTKQLPNVQIIGDDLFVTNPDRLKKGIQMGAANTVLWKVNQIGTLTEALDVAEIAYRHGYGVQVSERSGETEDAIIADLVVALNAGQIKTGMTVRGERTSKFNQLLRIEEELGNQAVYAGKNFRWKG
jgi:enolase